MKIVIIPDEQSGKFFGFVKTHPCICAQANTKCDVRTKIDRYFDSYMNR